MSQTANAPLRSAQEIIRDVRVTQAPNGVCYTALGEVTLPSADLERMVRTVPRAMAAALDRKAFYFVPLAFSDGDDPLIAERFDAAFSAHAACHRDVDAGDAQCVFISTRLLDDRFSVAFEFYIHVGHTFVEKAGISPEFADLVWSQALANVRGETSLEAFESRKQALSSDAARPDEKAKSTYLSAAFSDAIAIYLLSLYLDVVDYYELREREYPLLAPSAMAQRLKKVAELFPPEPGFEFNIFYKRRA
ncbi:MAG TPA: hypothetical protein VKE93_06050 [Candidatus Angelobacter sp.]|nr:hypothetical protein [Candidatus Angelobacter sp.]